MISRRPWPRLQLTICDEASRYSLPSVSHRRTPWAVLVDDAQRLAERDLGVQDVVAVVLDELFGALTGHPMSPILPSRAARQWDVAAPRATRWRGRTADHELERRVLSARSVALAAHRADARPHAKLPRRHADGREGRVGMRGHGNVVHADDADVPGHAKPLDRRPETTPKATSSVAANTAVNDTPAATSATAASSHPTTTSASARPARHPPVPRRGSARRHSHDTGPRRWSSRVDRRRRRSSCGRVRGGRSPRLRPPPASSTATCGMSSS